MEVDRRWLWAGGILTIAGGALALGVPIATLITLAAVLACPAAMYFGMGMMGRMQGGAEMGAGGRALDGRGAKTHTPLPLPAPTGTGAPSRAPALEAPPVNDDPVMILKRRLAAGEITLEEYDRLLAAISRPDPVRDTPVKGQGTSR